MKDETTKIQFIMELKTIKRANNSGLNRVDVNEAHVNVVFKVGELMNSIGLHMLSCLG